MIGAMQDWPLTLGRLIDHAAVNHPQREIVSLLVEGGEHRTNWAEVRDRARRLAAGLTALGMRPDDRIATLAWNTHRHVECLYGIAGMGGVAHTINPRLFDDQIVFIANHAADRVLLFDLSFIALVERIAPRLETIEHFVVLTDRAHMPESSLDLMCYEELGSAADPDFAWVAREENAPAGLCYTSGTTGNPKGVLYSHRSTVLHAMAACTADAFAIGARTVALPVSPIYHASAWSIPYASAVAGAKLVLAGPHFDGATLQRLIVAEDVDFALAVPTIWLTMLHYLDASGLGLGKLDRLAIGGSAVPRSMIEAFAARGVTVSHLWGMTEMSPVGSVGAPTPEIVAQGDEADLAARMKQGRALFGVEMKVVDDANADCPRDGTSFGRLLVRGPWTVATYFRGDGGQVTDAEGWFDTGDVATIDRFGYMAIVDRSKDVIKSGGEWISSIELENAAVGCPGVLEAAVIGVPHPKWDERPLLIVVRKPGASVTRADMLAYLTGRIAKWWMPDDVVFIDELPHTATGKLLKTALREQFRGHVLAA
ncbi:long-chain-fatty-acid--CoA ligase [Polymorphobacter sp. PAMC 29334]|uniref:long-chain-fatty-acid--CoA ligase n=1 Tax=Polymorphobacter sp. PAMC 29334 TaxID=2862331 RepID=UPI001C7701D2|nr:long-chain-fatty-acid--CoA ligase [Polymorphobacter sp. PAMC 29334]QYE34279.1 long-chain-fatty-acid--CoA ligase [Polymorphobacter sp. PAMC 29334]